MSSVQEQKKSEGRYVTVPSEKGIRKDLITGRYQASKSFKQKRFSKDFDTLKEARHWRNTFMPKMDEEPNETLYFEEVWKKYCELGLVTVSYSTREVRMSQLSFLKGLFPIPMNRMSPQVISQHIIKQREEALRSKNGRRFSFDNEINTLKTVFNWYREEIDFKFINPVLKKHRVLGRIKEKKMKAKKMEPQELLLFLDALRDKGFWFDFAMVQLAFAARVQEIAGLQKANIDLERNLLTIKDVVVWSRSTRKFVELKSSPKNGEIRSCYMTQKIREIIERRMTDEPRSSTYVFHIDGEPISYRTVQHHYDHALKKCGLYGKYSSTHFMRHTMATLTRMVTGSLESVQAVTGHKDQRLVQHYAALDPSVQKNALEQVEEFLQKESLCGQMRSKAVLEVFPLKKENSK